MSRCPSYMELNWFESFWTTTNCPNVPSLRFSAPILLSRRCFRASANFSASISRAWPASSTYRLLLFFRRPTSLQRRQSDDPPGTASRGALVPAHHRLGRLRVIGSPPGQLEGECRQFDCSISLRHGLCSFQGSGLGSTSATACLAIPSCGDSAPGHLACPGADGGLLTS